jgi:small subunit ribosomal protein S14
MATTAKIEKDKKLLPHREKKTPKLGVRHRNRCFRCGRPRGFMRKFQLVSATSRWPEKSPA